MNLKNLKLDKKTLPPLIALNFFMAIASNVVDWPWLMSVDWYLMPFAPICSLYPLTLAIWFTVYYFRGKAPQWLTTFIFIGITSYGVMAYLYFPLLMSWEGFSWWRVGNMFWVTIYALQSLIIATKLRPLKLFQYVPVAGYFFFKDFADRFLGTFIDVRIPGYPEFFKNFFGVAVLLLHCAAIAAAVKIAAAKKNVPQWMPVPESVLDPQLQERATE